MALNRRKSTLHQVTGGIQPMNISLKSFNSARKKRKNSQSKTNRSQHESQKAVKVQTYRVQTADHVAEEIKKAEDGAENYE